MYYGKKKKKWFKFYCPFAFGFFISLICFADVSKATTGKWVNFGPGNVNVSAIAIDPITPSTIYIGVDGGIYKSTDGGENWKAINTWLPSSTFIYMLAIDPKTPSTLYASTNDRGVFRSMDSGESWIDINAGLSNPYTPIFAIDPTTPSALYVWTGSGMFKSNNSGDNWQLSNTGLGSETISALIIDPINTSTLYAVDYYAVISGGKIFKSTDAGLNWKETASAGLPGAHLGPLVIDPINTSTLYAGTYAGYFKGGLYKSTDGGESWRESSAGLPKIENVNTDINGFAINPKEPTTLYARSWVRGIFESVDGGGNWQTINDGLDIGKIEIRSLAIDPVNPSNLYIGTNRGAFKRISGNLEIDSLAQLSSLTSQSFINESQNDKDLDGDGIPDKWEEEGFDSDGDGKIDVDLPGMGAKKDHKDIFVYVDWFVNRGLLGVFGRHSHKPYDDAIKKVKEAFANAPVDNEDGKQGINLHIILGHAIDEAKDNSELGSFSSKCAYNWQQFATIKDNNFPKEMRPIFHYTIFAHSLPALSCLDNGHPSGISRNGGGADFSGGASDFIVALNEWSTSYAQAGTFMHELGHNLGLGHGGLILDKQENVVDADYTGYKPNYLSIMNYSFQMNGLYKNGSNGHIDYSRFGPDDLPNLDENNLSEQNGLQGSNAVKDYGTRYYCQEKVKTVNNLQQAVNWNCNKNFNLFDIIDRDPVSTNINTKYELNLTSLATVNEWPHLRYNGGSISDAGLSAELPMETSIKDSPELTIERAREIDPGFVISSIFVSKKMIIITASIITLCLILVYLSIHSRRKRSKK